MWVLSILSIAGRRLLILVPWITHSLGSTYFLLNAIFFDEIPADYLVFGGLTGIVGGLYGFFMGIYTYLAVISSGMHV